MQTSRRQPDGFALLLTLIVVSVVLAIGLSLLNITLKQFTLSATARDSEIAFHTANTGLECVQYNRSIPATFTDLVDGGAAPSFACAGVSPVYTATDHDTSLGGGRYVYNYLFRYDTGESTCIEASLYLFDTRASSASITNYSVNEGLERLTCGPGIICTTIFSRGFNRGCGDLDSIRVVQRELTIQY